MEPELRPVTAQDAASCGAICFEAFGAIARAHNFLPDFPVPEAAIGTVSMLLANSGFYGVVAELDGKIAGSNFIDERGAIFGIGPITVDPQAQNHGIGRRLMLAVMERARRRGAAGVRLVQAGYHTRSLSLYTKLGFAVREHLSCMQGPAFDAATAGYPVRAATGADKEACNRLCLRVHGHTRSGELADAIRGGSAVVVERAGRITGYATAIAFFGHAVGETNEDLMALIAAAKSFAGPGILVPSRNLDLLRWCLDKGLRITQPMTLMTTGLYNEPAAAYLPSVLY